MLCVRWPQVTVASRTIFDDVFAGATQFLADGSDLASASVDELRDAAIMCGTVRGVIDVDDDGLLTKFVALSALAALTALPST